MMSKKQLAIGFKLLFSGAIIGYIFAYKVDFSEIWSVLKGADVFLLLVVEFLFVAMAVLGLIRWGALLRIQAIMIPWLRVARYYCVGMFFNTFLLGMTGGDVVKIYYVAKQSKKALEASSTIVFDRIVGLAGLVVLAFFSLLSQGADSVFAPLWMPISVTMGLVFGGVTFLMYFQFLSRWIPFFSRITAIKKLHWLMDLVEVFALYRHHQLRLWLLLLLSVGIHFGVAGSYFLMAQSIGLEEVTLAQFCVVIPVIMFVSALPISVAGWGVGEAAAISLLGLFGVSASAAVTLSVLFKLFYLLTGLLCVGAYVAPGLDHHPLKHAEEQGLA